jgi:hypothetical protein
MKPPLVLQEVVIPVIDSRALFAAKFLTAMNGLTMPANILLHRKLTTAYLTSKVTAVGFTPTSVTL